MAKRQRLTREESKARTRAEVLRAAARLFLRDGFVATSLAAIAEEAGVTKGAVYSNFESKEDLFYAIVLGEGSGGGGERTTPETLAPADLRELEGDAPRDERLTRHGGYLASLQPTPEQVALFLEFNAFALRSERTRAWVGAHNREFLVKQAAQLQSHFDDDAEFAAVVAQSLYVGLLLHRTIDPDLIDDDTFQRAFALLDGVHPG